MKNIFPSEPVVFMVVDNVYVICSIYVFIAYLCIYSIVYMYL